MAQDRASQQTPLGTNPTTGQLAVDQQRNQLLSQIAALLLTLGQSGGLKITSSVPATDTSPGLAGTIAYSTTFLFVCVASNTWRRVAISTF